MSMNVYPKPAATHAQVVADRTLFEYSHRSLLHHLGKARKVPRVNGREVDLFLLYSEVTRHGGRDAVTARKQWVLVCDPFNFPRSFTNKSYVIKRLYTEMLHHYEQLYFYRRQGPLVPAEKDEEEPEASARLAARQKRQRVLGADADGIRIIPERFQEVAMDLPAGTCFSGSIDGTDSGGGYLATLQLPNQTVRSRLFTGSSITGGALLPAPMDSPQRSPLPAHGTPVTPNSGVQQPTPKAPKSAFDFFKLKLDVEELLQLYPGRKVSPEQLPQLVSDMWHHMEPQHAKVFSDMEARDYQRHAREWAAYQHRSPVSAAATREPRGSRSCPPALSQALQMLPPARSPARPLQPHRRQPEAPAALQHPDRVHSTRPPLPPVPEDKRPVMIAAADPEAKGSAAACEPEAEVLIHAACGFEDPSEGLALTMRKLQWGNMELDAMMGSPEDMIGMFGAGAYVQIESTKPGPKQQPAAGTCQLEQQKQQLPGSMPPPPPALHS